MLLGYLIFRNSLDSIDFESKTIINTINSHSYITAKSDLKFQNALKSSDILIPDGIGIAWADFFLNGYKTKKIAGYDLFLFLMEKLNIENGSVFFLGSSEETLIKIKTKCKSEYPNVSCASYSPPFKTDFNLKDSVKMCDKVNSFSPDVLFVGMTAPKQEKWINDNKNNLCPKVICAVGGVFDFYSGNVKRYKNTFINNSGLEGLVRLISKPTKKLLYRNFYSVPKFIFEVLYHKFINKNYVF